MNYNWDNSVFKEYVLESERKQISLDLELYKLIAYKEMIDTFTNSNIDWQYTISNGKQHQLRNIIDEIDNIRWIDLIEDEIKNNISSFSVHICYDADNFNELFIQTYLKKKNTLLGKSEDELIEIINAINEKIYNELINIYNMIKEGMYIDNYFIENVEIEKGKLSGYYNLDWIILNCGKKNDNTPSRQIVKCKVKYFKIICGNLKHPIPTIETLYINRRITFALIQVFTRCCINPVIKQGIFYNSMDKGKYIKIDRGNEIIHKNYEEIPTDTKELLDKFYNKLEYEKQSLYLTSCDAYIDAQKASYSKAVTLYTIALENLANYKYKGTKMGKTQRIYMLIKDIFKKEIISKDFIDYIYSIRCLYAHEGIANNRIKQEAFEVYDADSTLEKYMEEITYSVLVEWLIQE